MNWITKEFKSWRNWNWIEFLDYPVWLSVKESYSHTHTHIYINIHTHYINIYLKNQNRIKNQKLTKPNTKPKTDFETANQKLNGFGFWKIKIFCLVSILCQNQKNLNQAQSHQWWKELKSFGFLKELNSISWWNVWIPTELNSFSFDNQTGWMEGIQFQIQQNWMDSCKPNAPLEYTRFFLGL